MRRAMCLLVLSVWACGEDEGPDPAVGMDASVSGNNDAGQNNQMNDLTCRPGFGAADACGGDPTGTWNYRNGCATESAFAELTAMCTGVEVMNEARTTQGTLVMQANGSFTLDVNTLASGNLTVPSTCALMAGGCAGIEALIEGSGPDTMATCTGIAACECAVNARVRDTESGTWTQSGGVVTTVTTEARQHHVCVEGNVLRYRDVPTGGEATVSYTLEKN